MKLNRSLSFTVTAILATGLLGVGTATARPAPSSTQVEAITTQQQHAAAIYAQAVGLGLGEVAALVGIGVGIGESALVNDTEGDCWYGSCKNGRTSARGVFQQFYGWVPPGTAWSGQKYGPQSGGVGTDFSGFNSKNAWGSKGWAEKDLRMNVAQAANMFFLGPEYARSSGLEDNKRFQLVQGQDPFNVSARQLATIAQEVQGFPISYIKSYEKNMVAALAFLRDIKSGTVPLPKYQVPALGVADQATTKTSRAAVLRDGPGLLAASWSVSLTGARYAKTMKEFWNTDPSVKRYSSSGLVAASYRFATKDALKMSASSLSMWEDTKNIILVPYKEARAGDILFAAVEDSLQKVSAAGIIVNSNSGNKTIWHVCGWEGSGSCSVNGNVGIGYGDTAMFPLLMTVSNPSMKDTPAERKKYLATKDISKAYVGRIVYSEK